MPHYASCEYHHHPKLMNNTTLVFTSSTSTPMSERQDLLFMRYIYRIFVYRQTVFFRVDASGLTLGGFYPEHFLALTDRTRREREVYGLWFSISLSLSPLHYTIQPTSRGSALLTSTSALEDERTKYCNSVCIIKALGWYYHADVTPHNPCVSSSASSRARKKTRMCQIG